MARGSKPKSTVSIPGMKDVEGRSVIPEGEHLFTVEELTLEEGEKGDYLKWKLSCDKGVLYHNTSLAPQALWNVKGLFEAMGIDPPDDDEEMEIEEFIGKAFMGNVEHEAYNGRMQSRLVDYWPTPEDSKTTSKPSSKTTSKDEDSDGDGKSDKNARRRERRAERRSTEKEDVKEDVKKDTKKDTKKGPAKLSGDEVNGMDEEKLAGVIEEYELDVDLDDHATLRKKKAAVVKALEEGDHLED